MASDAAGIALGCTTCRLELFLTEPEETELRAALAGFFAAHDGCDVFMDVSRTAGPLPRPARG